MFISDRETHDLLTAIAPVLASFPRRSPSVPQHFTSPDSDMHYDNGPDEAGSYAHQTIWEDQGVMTAVVFEGRRVVLTTDSDRNMLMYFDLFGPPLTGKDAIIGARRMISELRQEQANLDNVSSSVL